MGHPNKGKSSLVATLAQDDTVPVAAESGTTRRAVHYPMRVNGTALYELIDTPGFQRARKALNWLRHAASTAAERPMAVRRFVTAHRDDPEFHAEVGLLAPIVDGAGIIYVVDGAVPYGPEYEPEMEILRWSGNHSLAVINAIGEPRHVSEWRNALGQYFRVVREVNVLSAPLEQRLDLLRAFGEMDPDWRPALQNAIDALLRERDSAHTRSARIIAELISDALVTAPELRLAPGMEPERARRELEDVYRARLRELERRARDRVEQTYHHTELTRNEMDLEIVDTDLFEQRTWELFGLSRKGLATLGASGGAAAGAGIDAALGGASLLLGTFVGAVTGGAAAWLASDRLADVEHRHLPFGDQVLQIRAGANRNLPFVLLGRARVHHSIVSRRNHGRREALVVEEGAGAFNPLTAAQRSHFGKLFGQIARSASESREALIRQLSGAVEELLNGP